MTHEVYIARCQGHVVYIGSGRLGRNAHVNSGVSNCYELNRLHFSGNQCDVEVIPCDSKESCDVLEKELVLKYLPRGNRDLFLSILDNPMVTHTLKLFKEINKCLAQDNEVGIVRNLRMSAIVLFSIRYSSFNCNKCVISRNVVQYGYKNIILKDCYPHSHKSINTLFDRIDRYAAVKKQGYQFIKDFHKESEDLITFTVDEDSFLETSYQNFICKEKNP